MSGGYLVSDATNPLEWHEVDGSNPIVKTYHKYELAADGELLLHVRQVLEDPGAFTDEVKVDRDYASGQRWGDGQVIGRIPDSFMYTSGYSEARRNKDEAWIRRFWNDPEHRKLRVKEGNI